MLVTAIPAWLTSFKKADHSLLESCLPKDFYHCPRPLGLAVSGGSDSLAMLYLAAALKAQLGLSLHVATVDHRLRPEARQEAESVAKHAARLGLSHEILTWEAPSAQGNLMQEASLARYALLRDWAKRCAIADIAIAHTADDQAETFLMALSRAAGLDGLSGMRPRWCDAGVTFHRPLLGVTRQSLRDYLTRHNVAWIDDPSNENIHYTRVRIRQALAHLAPLGISADTIAKSAAHMANARTMRDEICAETFANLGREAHGALYFDAAGFNALHEEVRRRLFTLALRWFSAERHPPRALALSRLLAAAADGKSATLGGMCLHHRKGEIELSREFKAALAAKQFGDSWDHRWQAPALDAPFALRALGEEGLAQLPDWRALAAKTGVSRRVCLTTPAIWQHDLLIFSPLLEEKHPLTANCPLKVHPSFGSFVLSH